MKLRHIAFFLRRNLRRRRGRTYTAIGAIAVAILIFHLMGALALSLRTEVLGKIEKIFPEKTLLVRAGAIELGPLAFSPAFLTARITPQLAEQISRLAGVETVWPQLPLTLPALAEGQLFSYKGSTDIVGYGVPPDMVKSEVVSPRGFTYLDPTSYTVPVIVSRYFVDLYNLGLAEGQGLPKLTDSAVVGRHFQLVLGKSVLQTDINPDKVSVVNCEIVGLTQNASLLGLTLPIQYVREFNRWYHGPKAIESYAQLHVILRSTQSFDEVAKTIESWGLQVIGQRDTARRLRMAVNGAALILLLFGLAILAMAAANIVNTFALIMLERRGEIGLLRAVGATRRATMGLLLAESLWIGLVGGAVGSGIAWFAAQVLNRALLRWLPKFSLMPEQWLDERASLFLFCVALAVLASTLATAPMLWRSVRRWPADLLRE